MNAERQAAVALIVSVVVGAAMAVAGGDNGLRIGAVSVFAFCVMIAFLVNWIAFIPAYLRQTERFYDICGTATYITMVAIAVWWGSRSSRALLLAGLVLLWALRLGSFLFRRISQDGSDGRFDPIKPSAVRFASAWTMQALWCVMTFGCALAAMTAQQDRPLNWSAGVGLAIWIAGFAIEATADRQKRAFRRDPANDGRFITSGLWAWSRHPNYFGEIVLWIGVAIIAAPALRGWQYVTLISPVFVYLLLTRVSGIPLLEARARKRWGDDEEFRDYTQRTQSLVLRPPKH